MQFNIIAIAVSALLATTVAAGTLGTRSEASTLCGKSGEHCLGSFACCNGKCKIDDGYVCE
ncbi:hypothetical protein MaudMau93_001277 [Microsporum audouinii]